MPVSTAASAKSPSAAARTKSASAAGACRAFLGLIDFQFAAHKLFAVHFLDRGLTFTDFYHLDTCLSVLDERTALVYPDAFSPEGLDIIRSLFERVLESPEPEARHQFAVNAHCPDGKHVLIQEGCRETESVLRSVGFTIIPVNTDEFLKAGGSAKCLTLKLTEPLHG